MFVRTMLAVAAVAALGSGCHPRSPDRPSAEAPAKVRDSKSPIKLTEAHYTTDEGHKLIVRFDGDQAARLEATDARDRKLDVIDVPLSEARLCLPKRAAGPAGGTGAPADDRSHDCQTLRFMTEGTQIKMGDGTCYCEVVLGQLKCTCW